MTNPAAVDNDVLIKLACYDVLRDLATIFGGSGRIGILGVARFVVTKTIQKRQDINDPTGALRRFEEVMHYVEELEPTSSEIELATELEEAAIKAAVRLDFGESQLCAVVLSRLIPVLITGDKRAILAAEAIRTYVGWLTKLDGKLVCLEQLILGMTARFGYVDIRTKICAEPKVDKTMFVCFSCAGQAEEATETAANGLRSYINDMRKNAPILMYPADAMPASFEGTRHTARPAPPQV